jgi:haloacid dehalogenase superfamily, subfamily IA, variant 1 with third motif having Dx(3-4)D or Dx(3-4)E
VVTRKSGSTLVHIDELVGKQVCFREDKDLKDVKCLLFDWGDTLMADYPEYCGAMVTWERVSPMPEVVETLPEISKHFQCVVASNAVESNAELMKQAFQRIDIDNSFSLFVTSKELGAVKPESAFFEGVADMLHLKTSEMCMIGNDYNKDIVGAKNAGMKTVLITEQDGGYPAADHVIASFGKLSDVFCISG